MTGQNMIDFKKRNQTVFLFALRGADGMPPMSIRAACKAAGINRGTFLVWKETDPDFMAEYAAAIEDGTDTIEDVATDWAMNGKVEERQFDEGGKVASEKIKHDSSMMRFILGGRRPERYRQGGDVNVQVNANNAAPADDTQIARALALLLAQTKMKQVESA